MVELKSGQSTTLADQIETMRQSLTARQGQALAAVEEAARGCLEADAELMRALEKFETDLSKRARDIREITARISMALCG